jgi:DNA-binding Xre family transcriptional regulator
MLRSRIDYILLEKRIKVGDLTERSGLAKETVLRARKDETLPSCSLRTLEAIAQALGVKVKDLFDEV